jgi:hypothetical protein
MKEEVYKKKLNVMEKNKIEREYDERKKNETDKTWKMIS